MLRVSLVRNASRDTTQRMARQIEQLVVWVIASGGIAHRNAAGNAGFPLPVRRAAVRCGALRRVRREWLATDAAPADLLIAAENGGSLTCVSAARRRAWWIPEGVDDSIHVRLEPHAASPVSPVVAHWTQRIAPAPGYGLLESVEDTLAHISVCLAPEDAQIVWNSALQTEKITPMAIRRVHWPHRQARECAQRASGQSDSGLETILVVRLSGWGVPLRQQVVLLGRPVDLLIGERLVIQVDGFAHHSSSAQRSKDVAFDAELSLNGYTVFRFTYEQVVRDWDTVERTIARAIAAGVHLAR
jgi:very-short-patch-repair endonuclease